MFERKFLAYILYITLLEIRESAYADNNSRLYHLTDMLHNIPFSLCNDELAKEEYGKLLQTVEDLQVFDWLSKRMNEFKARYPELNNSK